MFVWPLLFPVSNKYMLVIDSILIAIVAVYGLNLLTGFAGLISIGHAAFVGVGAYALATFSRLLGSDHVLLTHFWPLMIVVAPRVRSLPSRTFSVSLTARSPNGGCRMTLCSSMRSRTQQPAR
jgi:ABC-type branched-subunit amino acid transport system permease subunit